MKRLIAFIFLLGALGAGAYYYFVARKPVEKPQVLYAAISQGEVVESVQASGTLDPVRRVDVGSQVSGQVQELFVDFNSVVSAGMLLAKIDPTLLETQVAIQQATVERQRGDIVSQEVQLEDLKVQLGRTRAMFEKGLQNQQQLDQAELSVKTRQAQIDSAKKSLVQAEANLDQAKLNVSYTDIKSPIDGVVVDRKVDRGQTVQASMNSPSFFILATDLRTLKLTAGVDEAEIGRVRPGQQVIFQVDAYGTQEFLGVVDAVRLNATNQNNVVTYPVWITVDNPDFRLRPSMTANARIIISRAPGVLRAPNQALRFRPNNDIYVALGLEPPAAGQGRAGRSGEAGAAAAPGGAAAPAGAATGNGRGDDSAAGRGRSETTPATPGASGAAASERGATGAAREPGRGGRGGDRATGGTSRRGSGQGFGAQAGGNLDPEAMARLREQFGGGRGGGGGQSRSGRGGAAAAPQVPAGERAPITARRIDEMFVGLQKQVRPGAIWTWDEPTKTLKRIDVRLGVDDGTFTEIVSGDVTPGMQVVTGIVLPQARTTQQNNNSLFNPNQRGGPPGGMSGFGGDRGGGGGRSGGGR